MQSNANPVTNTVEQTPKQRVLAAMAALGLTVESVFVPFSKSRSKDQKDPSLNWSVTLKREGRAFLTTDYGAGSAHCPSYKQLWNATAYDKRKQRDLIAAECEKGFAHWYAENIGGLMCRSSEKYRINPDAADVVWSLLMDSDVLDCGGFEDWAGNLGYDTDSRKAESIYRACLGNALKLRQGVGESGLAALREASQDY